jgi:hypothetical protein
MRFYRRVTYELIIARISPLPSEALRRLCEILADTSEGRSDNFSRSRGLLTEA